MMCLLSVRRVDGSELELEGPAYYPVKRHWLRWMVMKVALFLCNSGWKESVKLAYYSALSTSRRHGDNLHVDALRVLLQGTVTREQPVIVLT